MLIFACDPGLRDLGWALLDARTSRLVGCGHVTTERGDATGDTQRRLLEATAGVLPQLRRASLAAVEWSSSSASGFGRGSNPCPVCHRSAPGNAQAALMNAAMAAAVIGAATALSIQTLTPAPVTWRAGLGFARDEAGLHARLSALYPRTVARFRRGALPHVLDAIGLAVFARSHATNLFTDNRTTTRGTATP